MQLEHCVGSSLQHKRRFTGACLESVGGSMGGSLSLAQGVATPASEDENIAPNTFAHPSSSRSAAFHLEEHKTKRRRFPRSMQPSNSVSLPDEVEPMLYCFLQSEHLRSDKYYNLSWPIIQCLCGNSSEEDKILDKIMTFLHFADWDFEAKDETTLYKDRERKFYRHVSIVDKKSATEFHEVYWNSRQKQYFVRDMPTRSLISRHETIDAAAWAAYDWYCQVYTTEQVIQLFTVYAMPNLSLRPERILHGMAELERIADEAEERAQERAGLYVDKLSKRRGEAYDFDACLPDPFGGLAINAQDDGPLIAFLSNACPFQDLCVWYPPAINSGFPDVAPGKTMFLYQLGGIAGSVHSMQGQGESIMGTVGDDGECRSQEEILMWNPATQQNQVYSFEVTQIKMLERCPNKSLVRVSAYALNSTEFLAAISATVDRGCTVHIILNANIYGGADGANQNHRLAVFLDAHKANNRVRVVEHRESTGDPWNVMHAKDVMTVFEASIGSSNPTQGGGKGVNVETGNWVGKGAQLTFLQGNFDMEFDYLCGQLLDLIAGTGVIREKHYAANLNEPQRVQHEERIKIRSANHRRWYESNKVRQGRDEGGRGGGGGGKYYPSSLLSNFDPRPTTFYRTTLRSATNTASRSASGWGARATPSAQSWVETMVTCPMRTSPTCSTSFAKP